MLVAGHTSALRRRSEIRAMPGTEKPPAKPVDIYCVQKSNESRYFYRILIEIYKRTLFYKRKFAIILIKEAVTEMVKLRYKYRKESNEC